MDSMTIVLEFCKYYGVVCCVQLHRWCTSHAALLTRTPPACVGFWLGNPLFYCHPLYTCSCECISDEFVCGFAPMKPAKMLSVLRVCFDGFQLKEWCSYLWTPAAVVVLRCLSVIRFCDQNDVFYREVSVFNVMSVQRVRVVCLVKI